MTVICTDGKVMAGDGLVVAGTVIVCDDFPKVRRLKDGSVFGAAGDIRDVVLAFDWLERGAPFDTIPKFSPDADKDSDGFEALVLRPDGRVEWFDQMCVFVPYSAPYAIGCGSDVALTCLHLGMTPAEAVERAAHQNSKVGGKTVVLSPTRKRRP